MPAPPEQPAEPAPRPPDREAPEGEGPAPASEGQPAPWMPAPEPQQLLHPRQVSAPSALEPGAAAPAPLAGAKAFGRLWHIHHCILITHHCTLITAHSSTRLALKIHPVLGFARGKYLILCALSYKPPYKPSYK